MTDKGTQSHKPQPLWGGGGGNKLLSALLLRKMVISRAFFTLLFKCLTGRAEGLFDVTNNLTVMRRLLFSAKRGKSNDQASVSFFNQQPAESLEWTKATAELHCNDSRAN